MTIHDDIHRAAPGLKRWETDLVLEHIAASDHTDPAAYLRGLLRNPDTFITYAVTAISDRRFGPTPSTVPPPEPTTGQLLHRGQRNHRRLVQLVTAWT